MRIAQQFTSFLMKCETHRQTFLFATRFSGWLEDVQPILEPASAGLLNSSRSPAEAGLRNKVLDRGPPTEVGGKQDSCDVAGFNPREASRRLKSAAPWIFSDRA